MPTGIPEQVERDYEAAEREEEALLNGDDHDVIDDETDGHEDGQRDGADDGGDGLDFDQLADDFDNADPASEGSDQDDDQADERADEDGPDLSLLEGGNRDDVKSPDKAIDWEQRAKVAEGRLAAQGQQFSQVQAELADVKKSISGLTERDEQQRIAQARAAFEAKQAKAKQLLADEYGHDETYLEAMQVLQQNPDEFAAASVGAGNAADVAGNVGAGPAAGGVDAPAAGGSVIMDRGAYNAAVLARYPKADAINNSAHFNQWLVSSGRFESVVAADRRNDSVVVIDTLDRYAAEVRRLQGADADGGRAGQGERGSSVDRQIAPSRQRASRSRSNAGNQPLLTEAQINEVNRKFEQGHYNVPGGADRWAKMEVLIERSWDALERERGG